MKDPEGNGERYHNKKLKDIFEKQRDHFQSRAALFLLFFQVLVKYQRRFQTGILRDARNNIIHVRLVTQLFECPIQTILMPRKDKFGHLLLNYKEIKAKKLIQRITKLPVWAQKSEFVFVYTFCFHFGCVFYIIFVAISSHGKLLC